jgi:hypothetical protein
MPGAFVVSLHNPPHPFFSAITTFITGAQKGKQNYR